MIEIREPTEIDRDQVANVMRVSLNLGRPFVEHRAPRLPLHAFRCAYDCERVAATAAVRTHRQWFGGVEVPMAGIWGVSTLPEHRGAGLATRAVARLLEEAREQGVPISALYPAAVRPYRGLGYELAGAFTKHEVGIEDLPRAEGVLTVDEYRPEDLDAVRACYRSAASPHNGPIDCDDRSWWPERIMEHWNADENFRAVVARDEGGGIRGYASFLYERVEGHLLDIAFRLACKHFVAMDEHALDSLLAYFRGFRGLGQSVSFTGPPADPLAMLVDEQRVLPSWTFRWMLRLLDVPAAIEARGYPAISGEATIAVEDPMFPENRGPFRLEADGGKVRATRVDRTESRPINVRALAAMYAGHLHPIDAVRIGWLDPGDPSVPLLTALFAGPAPWMYDFF